MTAPHSSPGRTERVGRHVAAHEPLRGAIRAWETAVLALSSLDGAVVEAVRLRAARHHDCVS